MSEEFASFVLPEVDTLPDGCYWGPAGSILGDTYFGVPFTAVSRSDLSQMTHAESFLSGVSGDPERIPKEIRDGLFYAPASTDAVKFKVVASRQVGPQSTNTRRIPKRRLERKEREKEREREREREADAQQKEGYKNAQPKRRKNYRRRHRNQDRNLRVVAPSSIDILSDWVPVCQIKFADVDKKIRDLTTVPVGVRLPQSTMSPLNKLHPQIDSIVRAKNKVTVVEANAPSTCVSGTASDDAYLRSRQGPTDVVMTAEVAAALMVSTRSNFGFDVTFTKDPNGRISIDKKAGSSAFLQSVFENNTQVGYDERDPKFAPETLAKEETRLYNAIKEDYQRPSGEVEYREFDFMGRKVVVQSECPSLSRSGT
ncbi:eukaryotic translation initiation factor 3 subunit D, partial [Kipferlia bialata]|eukprot:g3705.t1